MKRPQVLKVRDYRAEIVAWLDRMDEGCLHGEAFAPMQRALRAVVAEGSVSMHVKVARALGLEGEAK